MEALAARLRRAALAGLVGRCLPVLLERPDPRGRHWLGHTPNYLPVRLPAPADAGLARRIVPCRLTAVTADGAALLAELAP
jgi:hypothetical protein